MLAVEAIRDRLAGARPGGRPRLPPERGALPRPTGRASTATPPRASARIPPARRKLVTTHDALGYYARRYGLEVIGAVLPAMSTQAQPSARAVEALVDQIRSTGVKAIFPESSSTRSSSARWRARRRTSRRGALGRLARSRGVSGATYVGSVESNTRTIAGGLTAGAVTCPG